MTSKEHIAMLKELADYHIKSGLNPTISGYTCTAIATELEMLGEQVERLRESLESIRQYGSDTLSGRVDGPDDREWQRAAVREMTKRAREALAGVTIESPRPWSAEFDAMRNALKMACEVLRVNGFPAIADMCERRGGLMSDAQAALAGVAEEKKACPDCQAAGRKFEVDCPECRKLARSNDGAEALKVGHQTVNLASPDIAGSSPARSTSQQVETTCPRPFNRRPEGFTAAQCIAAGECGCDLAPAGYKPGSAQETGGSHGKDE